MVNNRYSVVIPVFNGADTIVQAIESVLAQDPAPQCIVVVDDGSTDDTAKVVSAMQGPITLIRQDNAGPGAATNAGFQCVDTPLVATLDADDLWLPNKIADQIAYLNQHPEVAAVFCPLAHFRDDPASANLAEATGGWSRSTMLIRREVIHAIGPIIDPPGRAGEMIDWLARAREQGHVLALTDKPLALRRIRPGSLTWRNAQLAQSYLHVARAALLRRREAMAAMPNSKEHET